MRLLGNLDCEARWAGVALPAAVVQRISLYAALFAACAPDDGEHEIWLPAPVDVSRLRGHPRWSPPTVRVAGAGAPAVDLAWADPAARSANDRSATLAIAQALGVALPGARVVDSIAELDAHLAGFTGPAWICKARWTAAGRDRARGAAGPLTGELRARIARMLARLGPLVFEPWLDRLADLGVCGEIATDGAVTVHAPHWQMTSPRGGFLGIALMPEVEPAIAEPLTRTARAAAALLAARTGYHGPFAIDAFVYRDGDRRALHPLCEINARHSFGWIARALAGRLGARRLGFDPAPAGATLLIAPGDDRVTAWCA